LDSSNDIYSEDIATPYVDHDNTNIERAEYYQGLATKEANFNDRVDSTLSAAEYYVQAGDYAQAEQSANSLNISQMNPTQINRYNIVKAYVDYSKGLYESALQRLQGLLTMQQASQHAQSDSELAAENQTQRVDALLLSSFCYQQLNNDDAAISALIERESLLSGNARAETSRYTWQIINSMTRQSRLSIINKTNNVLVRNRLEQSLEGQFAEQTKLPPQFDQWRKPSLGQTKQTIEGAWNASSPKKIAVLLPLTSRFNKAALAVMDGIEYRHDNNQSPYKPSIDFFDIGDNPYQASQYYSSIANMGFDLVIGPIGKDYANQIFSSVGSQVNATVPTILLGGDVDLNGQNYPTFSRLTMSPEAEGIEVANHAQRQGYVTAAVLAPSTEAGERSARAFQQQWLGLGGNISKVITYSPNQFDHSVELKQLFDINQSQARYRKISDVLGFKPEFLAYRRSDVDFIFMIADNESGRIVRPQINFFSGKTVPVYSTSSVFNGIQDQANNLDLEDTLFPVMPWILQSIDIAPYAGQLNMLFAMGSDAYQVAANYQTMRNNPELAISGKMGSLHMETSGEIIFEPIWAQYKNGLAEADDRLPILEGINQSIGSPNQSTSKGSNSYDDSNWDARRSSRKTGVSLPQ
ncbi:penicillin-binding protein activator, partial [Arenicella sp.]|nr:penicillin-binding protein activator [Arenicella sp.]